MRVFSLVLKGFLRLYFSHLWSFSEGRLNKDLIDSPSRWCTSRLLFFVLLLTLHIFLSHFFLLPLHFLLFQYMIELIFEMLQAFEIHLPQKFQNLLVPLDFNEHYMAEIFIEYLKDLKYLPAFDGSHNSMALKPEFGVVEEVIFIVELIDRILNDFQCSVDYPHQQPRLLPPHLPRPPRIPLHYLPQNCALFLGLPFEHF